MMLMPDVNVLVYAYRADVPRHSEYRDWLDELANGDSAFGLSELVLSGFLRIVTHPKIFDPPSPLEDALKFVEQLRRSPRATILGSDSGHWSIFIRLCRESGAKGNLIPDAYLAALAIEHGCTWVTADKDFSRFKGLDFQHPLDG